MKKYIIALLAVITLTFTLTGCQTEAQKVSQNLSLEADNFNNIRQITVINCLQGMFYSK